MASAIVTVHGGPSSIATVLGQSPPRIPTAGKIRAGIKVLTRTAADHPRACEIYERGVAAGESFDQIERLLAEALPKLRNPLVPRNVPWVSSNCCASAGLPKSCDRTVNHATLRGTSGLRSLGRASASKRSIWSNDSPAATPRS